VHTAVDAAMASGNLVHRVDMLTDAIMLAPGDPAVGRWHAEVDRLHERMGCAVATAPGRRTTTRKVRPQFGPDALTDAERRVALLVAEGLTNAKIAAQLVISRRTVDTQVLSAYRKLGVSSRVGLTRALLDDVAS
jgi:DNA-binding CsgD family transcriptional regulator